MNPPRTHSLQHTPPCIGALSNIHTTHVTYLTRALHHLIVHEGRESTSFVANSDVSRVHCQAVFDSLTISCIPQTLGAFCYLTEDKPHSNMAAGDHSAAPTSARCAAATFFSRLAGTQTPLLHLICTLIRDALFRQHGKPRHPKSPLLAKHLRVILTSHLFPDANLEALLTCLRITLMYEGCLRWSDLHQLTFGSCTLTPLHMCICITAAKNDKFHQGQWVTVPFSSDPISSFALFVKVRAKLIHIWDQASTQTCMTILGPTWHLPLPHLWPLEHIPLLISINPASNLPCCTPQVPYHSFLTTLKT